MIIKPKISDLSEKGSILEKLVQMKTGDTLEATVLKVMAQNRAELMVMGQKMLVDSDAALQKGQKLLLKVAKNSSKQTILKLMGDINSDKILKNGSKKDAGKIIPRGRENQQNISTYSRDLKNEGYFDKSANLLKARPEDNIKTQDLKNETRIPIGKYSDDSSLKNEVRLELKDLNKILKGNNIKEGTVLKAEVAEIKESGKYILKINEKFTEATITNLKGSNQPEIKNGDHLRLIVNSSDKENTFVTIKNPSNISKVLISSADIIPEDKLPFQIKNGDVLKGKVLNVYSPRVANIEIKGKEIQVRMNVPLEEGENILLRATKKGMNESFRIIKNETGNPLNIREGLLRALGKSGPFENLTEILKFSESDIKDKDLNPEIISRFKSIIKEISLKSGITDIDLLKTLVRKSGLSWENKLSNLLYNPKGMSEKPAAYVENDLKALTMDFLAKFGDDSEQGIRVRSFVETLEQFQLLNSQTSEESGKYIMPIPIFGNEMFKFGQLLIDLNSKDGKNKGGKEKVLRVSFMLEMSNLGDLRADFSMLKKGITGAFGVETEEARRFIKNRIPELERNLNKHEFQVHKIDCFVIDEEELKNRSLTDDILTRDLGEDEILNIVV
ncbi:MAG: flagellar hook-length control protein FliK [Deltaproteobacteria bacterium]|nr:flagellar hook-length control protein FliK [Deltaproteobacteria bacterium]